MEADYRPSSPFDHEPHGIGRFSSAVLFLGIWAGCAIVSFWHTTPPEFAAPMLWVGAVITAVAGYAVAGIRPLRPGDVHASRSASSAPPGRSFWA